MKRILLITAVLTIVIAGSADAQIQRGNVMVGSNLSNINLDLDGSGLFSFNLNPKVAWFIRDNVAVGGFLSAGLRTAKGQGTGINYGVGALARYYLGATPANGATDFIRSSRFFVEGTAGIQGDNPAVGNNTNGLGLGIGPGWTYFLTPNIGLEALVKYEGIVGFGSRPTSNNLSVGVGFQIYLSSARARAIRNQVESDIRR
ncbi:MAG: porin family protein [Sphingobacteriales bacterium]|nr:MAG: porin family protein [Sphingobacteriales bacterium]